jgi:hypothetical protein
LKADNSNPFKLNGMLKTNEHLIKQSKYITYLNTQGAYASFSTGVSETIELIDKYMQNEL